MELCDPPAGAKWGEFNDRPVDEKAVKELVSAFHKHVDNCTEGTAIDVVVRAGWLEDEAKLHSSVEGLGIWEVNALTFSEEGKRGIKAEALLMLGGNHRCQAVKRYVKALKKEREGIEKQQKAVRGKGKKTGGSIEDKGEATPEEGEEEAATVLRKLDEDIAKASQWVVRVYDRGEWGSATTESADQTGNRCDRCDRGAPQEAEERDLQVPVEEREQAGTESDGGRGAK